MVPCACVTPVLEPAVPAVLLLPLPSQEGVFHFNHFLTLDLVSPYFASGAPTSRHEVMVMKDLEDGVRSFAIDDFPAMDEAAIEAHWTRRVEERRAEREVAFAQMEREWDAEHPEEAAQRASEEEARREASRESRRRYARLQAERAAGGTRGSEL